VQDELFPCEHTCRTLCQQLKHPRMKSLKHQRSPEIHQLCSLQCPGFPLLIPKERRPLRVLFTLEVGSDAKNFKDALESPCHYFRIVGASEQNPAVLAWERYPHLQEKFVFRQDGDYVCHDWVRNLKKKMGGLKRIHLQVYICAGINDSRVKISIEEFSDFTRELSKLRLEKLALQYDAIVTSSFQTAMRW
jgi:hypothetical protein